MREEDGFQEAAGEKGGSGRTSEGKQKLMEQDVATDGSLHTSERGTRSGSEPPALNQEEDNSSQPSSVTVNTSRLLIGPLVSTHLLPAPV